jgi:hypothetical protein
LPRSPYSQPVSDLDLLYSQFLSRLTAPLKNLGFRRSGTTFFQLPPPPASNWFMASVQTTLVPEGREFVINYGVICPTLLASVDGWMASPPAPGKLPKRRGSQISWRLEAGWDERHGYSMERWWRITSQMSPTDLDELARVVASRIETEALPRLEPLATDEGLRDYYLEQLHEPDGWLAPIDLGRLIALLDRIGPADRIEQVRADAKVRNAAHEEQRSQVIAEFEPFFDDMAREFLRRKARLADNGKT